MTGEPLVGREPQLRRLGEFLVAIEAAPGALALEGEMGIGKTALHEAGLAAAAERGQHVLACRPSESETQFAYAALGDLLAGVSDEALADLPPPQRSALEVALLRAEPEEREPLPRAVALGFLAVVRTLARDRPTLLAIDDVQWLDRPSASALAFAVRRIADEPIGLLLTVRTDGPTELPLDLERALPMQRLRLGSLDDRDVDRLVSARLDRRIPRRLLAALRRRAGGNPLLALEIGRAVIAHADTLSEAGELPLPARLRALVRDRLAELPPDALGAAEVAAALSRPTAALVDTLTGGVEAAVRAGVLEHDGERVRFSHPLLASVAYMQIPAPRRRDLHARLAELVTEPEERGRHLGLAAAEPGAQVAAALDEAARRANARGAPDAAAELWEQARRLTPADAGHDGRERGLQAAERQLESGDVRRALALLEELAADAPRGQERARVLVRLGWVRAYGDGFGAGAEVFSDALAEHADDAALRVEIEQGLAWCTHSTAGVPAAVAHSRAAVELAETLDDPVRLAGALSQLALLQSLLGDGLAMTTIERAVDVAPGESMTPLRRAPEWIHAVLLQWGDDLAGARERLDALRREAVERGDEHSLPFVLFQLARVELLMGDWESARGHAAECHETTIQSGQAGEHPYSLAIGALVDAHLGAVEPAREKIAEGGSLARRHGTQPAELELLAARGFLELSLGDAAAADRTLAALAERARDAGFGEPNVFRFQGDAIEAKLAAGGQREAGPLVDELEQLGARLDRTWAQAVACRARALSSAAAGDLAGAYEALDRAVELHARLGQPFEHARTLLVLGSIQRRDRKKRAARESLGSARAIFERLGAELWSAKAEGELARVGGRAPTEGLTATEERVAELIAAGHTYQETADALFVSPKTVQWNLSKIYRKLGVRSRAELAARLRVPG